MESWRKTWTDPVHGSAYGELLFRRATGALPEMESSKATIRRIAGFVRDGDLVLDAGCGAGHFLVSMRRLLTGSFQYLGVDSTKSYIDLAEKAHAGAADCRFSVGDVFDLALEDRSVDLAMCVTVLPFLPSVAKPIAELCRVTRRNVLLRMLISDRSFVIREVASKPDGDEFDDAGEPRDYGYCNIFSHRYLHSILSAIPRVNSISIERDLDFDPRAFDNKDERSFKRDNATTVVNGIQVNGSIIMDWHFVTIGLSDE